MYQRSGAADRPPGKPAAPPLAEYSLEVEAIAGVYHRLGELMQITLAAQGIKKKLKLAPWPRPETAESLLRKRRVEQNKQHLMDVITFVDTKALPAADPPAASSTTTEATLSRVRR
jgi:hypothetical protein